MPIVAGRVGNVATVTGVARGKITGDGGNIVPPTIIAPSVPVHFGKDRVRRNNTSVDENRRTDFTSKQTSERLSRDRML
jgi:hypothetical protein